MHRVQKLKYLKECFSICSVQITHLSNLLSFHGIILNSVFSLNIYIQKYMVACKKWWGLLVWCSLTNSVWVAWAVLLQAVQTLGRSEKKLHNSEYISIRTLKRFILETTKAWLWHSFNPGKGIKIKVSYRLYELKTLFFLPHKVNIWTCTAGNVLTHFLKSEKSEASKQVQIFKKPLLSNVNAFVHVNEMNCWPAAN